MKKIFFFSVLFVIYWVFTFFKLDLLFGYMTPSQLHKIEASGVFLGSIGVILFFIWVNKLIVSFKKK